jgi:lysophospholipase L1-like esterase
MKIVFLGDSLTWGGYGGNYVDEIARLLPNHEIINAGQAGNTVVNLLNRVDDVINMQPDAVFVMVGGNDSNSYTQPATRPYYEQVQKIPNGIVTPDLFAQSYRELLSKLQLAHIETWVGLPPKEYNPAVVDAMLEYNAIAADIARSMNIPTLDLMAPFKPDVIADRPPIDMKFINLIGKRASTGWNDYETEQKRGGYHYTFDGLHFTPESANRAAKLIVDFLHL